MILCNIRDGSRIVTGRVGQFLYREEARCYRKQCEKNWLHRCGQAYAPRFVFHCRYQEEVFAAGAENRRHVLNSRVNTLNRVLARQEKEVIETALENVMDGSRARRAQPRH